MTYKNTTKKVSNNNKSFILKLAQGQATQKNIANIELKKLREKHPFNYLNRLASPSSNAVKKWREGGKLFRQMHEFQDRVFAFELAYKLIKNEYVSYFDLLKKVKKEHEYTYFLEPALIRLILIELMYRHELSKTDAIALMITAYESFKQELMQTVMMNNFNISNYKKASEKTRLQEALPNNTAENILKTAIFLPNKTRIYGPEKHKYGYFIGP